MKTIKQKLKKNELYAGMIWICSALALFIYGVICFFNTSIPGVEELNSLLTTADGKYIYIAAFVSVFIEGLYIIGNFFPGAGLVIILAILSRINSPVTLIITTVIIFFGWCLAGIINIYIAKIYRSKIIKLQHNNEYEIKDRVWTTWFPTFRSNYEVAQVTEGADAIKVFISSLRVRFFASLFVGALAFTIPYFYDIKQASNEEGIISLLVVAGISLIVGIVKIRSYLS